MKIAAVLIVLLSLLPSCTGCVAHVHADQPAKLVVVFLDISRSIRDYSGFRQAWEKVVDALRGGDRIVLATISDRTYTAFRPTLDSEIPTFSYLHDNKLAFEQRREALREALTAAFERAYSEPHSAETDLLDAPVLSEQLFYGDGRRHVLVLLTDGLEDSGEYNFERLRLTDQATTAILLRIREQGRLANLQGSEVYVAGISAKSASKAFEVGRFWLAYFKAANAEVQPSHIGPALVNFNE